MNTLRPGLAYNEAATGAVTQHTASRCQIGMPRSQACCTLSGKLRTIHAGLVSLQMASKPRH